MSAANWYEDNVFINIDDYQWFYEAFSHEAALVLEPIGLKIEVGFKALRHAHGRWMNLQQQALANISQLSDFDGSRAHIVASFAYLFYCLNDCSFEQHFRLADRRKIVNDSGYAPMFARKEAINVSFCCRAFLSSYDTIFGEPYPKDVSRMSREGWVSLVDRMRSHRKDAAEIFLEIIDAK